MHLRGRDAQRPVGLCQQAGLLAQAYRALSIPPAQVHGLDQPVLGRKAHGEGINNTAYAPLWRQMLSSIRPPP